MRVRFVMKPSRNTCQSFSTIIEYFDAVKVALTATPALHTTEIFGMIKKHGRSLLAFAMFLFCHQNYLPAQNTPLHQKIGI